MHVWTAIFILLSLYNTNSQLLFCLLNDYPKEDFVLYNIFMYHCLLHVTDIDWLIDSVYHYDIIYT